jgi:hypothetical protein
MSYAVSGSLPCSSFLHGVPLLGSKEDKSCAHSRLSSPVEVGEYRRTNLGRRSDAATGAHVATRRAKGLPKRSKAGEVA